MATPPPALPPRANILKSSQSLPPSTSGASTSLPLLTAAPPLPPVLPPLSPTSSSTSSSTSSLLPPPPPPALPPPTAIPFPPPLVTSNSSPTIPTSRPPLTPPTSVLHISSPLSSPTNTPPILPNSSSTSSPSSPNSLNNNVSSSSSPKSPSIGGFAPRPSLASRGSLPILPPPPLAPIGASSSPIRARSETDSLVSQRPSSIIVPGLAHSTDSLSRLDLSPSSSSSSSLNESNSAPSFSNPSTPSSSTSSPHVPVALSHEELLTLLKTHVPIGVHSSGGVSIPNSFHGKEVVDVIINHGVAKSRPAAHALCRLLMKQQCFVPMSGDLSGDFSDSETVFYSFATSFSLRPRSSSTLASPTLSKSQQREIKLKEKETQKNLEREMKQKKIQEKEQRQLEKERLKSLLKEQKQKDKAKKTGKAAGGKAVFSQNPACYQSFMQMLTNPDSVFVRSLCSEIPAGESEFLSQVLLAIFEHFHTTDLLTQVVIGIELEKTIHPGTLFRGNSLSSKVLTAYSRLVGINYVKTMFGPLLDGLISSSESYEVDPSKLQEGEDLATNIERVASLFQKVFDNIVQSTQLIPQEIKLICSSLYVSCNEKFPDSAQFAVGGFFFLRFLGPILVTPDVFGVTSQPCSPNIRRAILLVSKILQSLSNGVEFGVKEEFMMPLNHLLLENREGIANFIEAISKTETSGIDQMLGSSCSFGESTDLDYQDVGKLAKLVCRHFNKISNSFSASQASSLVSRIGKTISFDDELKQALTDIVPDAEKLINES